VHFQMIVIPQATETCVASRASDPNTHVVEVAISETAEPEFDAASNLVLSIKSCQCARCFVHQIVNSNKKCCRGRPAAREEVLDISWNGCKD